MIKNTRFTKKTLDYKSKLTQQWKCPENVLQCQPQILCNSFDCKQETKKTGDSRNTCLFVQVSKTSNRWSKWLRRVPCKMRSSVKSGAWLWRFDDVTGVEKGCVAKGTNGKKRKNILWLQINMRFPQASNAWKFAMFKNFIHSQLLKPIFCPQSLWDSDTQKLSNFGIDFYYRR